MGRINQRQFGKKYDTTEQLTGDIWINGKPIYRKTVSLGAMPNATTKNVAHGISSLENVIDTYGYVENGGTKVPLPFADTTVNGQMTVYISGSNIALWCGTNRSAYSGYLTIEYTKV